MPPPPKKRAKHSDSKRSAANNPKPTKILSNLNQSLSMKANTKSDVPHSIDTAVLLANIYQKYSPKRSVTVKNLLYDVSTQQEQCSTLLHFLGSQDLSDVTFAIGREHTTFNLNRVFLAMISPVFKAMLYGQMQEGRPNSDVVIEDITPDVFECIVHFAYCNNPNVTSQNVLFVLTACDKYQITKLQEICYQFFKSDLSTSNFIHYYYTAVAVGFHDETVVKSLESFFAEHYTNCLFGDEICSFFNDVAQSGHCNFVVFCKKRINESESDAIDQILKSDGFLSMSLQSMRLFLKQSIHCKEEMLWTAILRWARQLQTHYEESDDDCKCEEGENTPRALSESERSLLKSVRDLIRFGLMDGKYFSNHVIPTNVLSDKEVISVLRYYVNPERGCGVFDVTRRVQPIHELSFTLKMSSKYNHTACKNTAPSLSTNKLTEGCGTDKNRNPYIMAEFDAPVYVKHMMIAPHSTWPSELKHSRVEIHDEENDVWHIIERKLEIEKGQTQRLDGKVSRATKRVRVTKAGRNNVFIGFWQIYGFKK